MRTNYKYLVLLFTIFILVPLILYYKQQPKSVESVRKLYINIPKESWVFYPDTIKVKKGQKLEVHINNEDNFAHGFFIDELKVNQLVDPKTEIVFTFTPEKIGTFSFYCNVVCGEGHYRMRGSITVTKW